jgi:nucleoside-diphosphate-sugar epimerase
LKVFLTGGTGLIGSHTIEKLVHNGYTVDALVRNNAGAAVVSELGARPVRGDMEDAELWKSSDHEAIVHAAAVLPRRASWKEFESVNVRGTRMVARAAARNGARLVYLSTVAVYGSGGFAGDGSPIVEDTPFEPLEEYDYYGRSKRAAEQALWEEIGDSAGGAVALRPCVVYGERDRLFSPKIVSAAAFGLWPLIGNGSNTLTLVYAGNVADAVLASLEHSQVSGAFNVTNDGEITQRHFFSTIAAGAGTRLRFFRVPISVAGALASTLHLYKSLRSGGKYGGFAGVAADWLSRSNPYSSNKATTQLRWQPTTTPQDAARRTGEFFGVQR